MAGSMAVLLIEDYEDDVFLFERALDAVCPGVAFRSVNDAAPAQCYLRDGGVYGDRDAYPLRCCVEPECVEQRKDRLLCKLLPR